MYDSGWRFSSNFPENSRKANFSEMAFTITLPLSISANELQLLSLMGQRGLKLPMVLWSLLS